MSDDWAGYWAVLKSAGYRDRSDRCRLRISGPDRAKFLHNLTTNDVKRLAPGAGHEAFVTSPQGKCLGYVTLLACDSEILLRTDPGGLEHVLPHLQKYGIFDDVSIDDVKMATCELHIAGPEVEAILGRAGADVPVSFELAHHETKLGSVPVRLVRESPTGRPGWTIIAEVGSRDALVAALEEHAAAGGLVEVDEKSFDALRIEAGTPVFGQDITPENLPQEVGRDARAINFVKGCYLGQETVARIDALGHVNKLLKGLTLRDSALPPPGTALESSDGKKVGSITSSAFSPGWEAAVALAYVRTTHVAPGTELHIAVAPNSSTAIVADLPLFPPART